MLWKGNRKFIVKYKERLTKVVEASGLPTKNLVVEFRSKYPRNWTDPNLLPVSELIGQFAAEGTAVDDKLCPPPRRPTVQLFTTYLNTHYPIEHTLAHELGHYKQWLNGQLNGYSNFDVWRRMSLEVEADKFAEGVLKWTDTVVNVNIACTP